MSLKAFPTSQGELLVKVLNAREGLTLAFKLLQHSLAVSSITPDEITALLFSLPDSLRNKLINTLFSDAQLNNKPLDIDDDFSDYNFLIECLTLVFKENFGVFLSFVVKPFVKPDFVYDAEIHSLCAADTTKAKIDSMAEIDDVTATIQSVYFSELHHETWESLTNMSLGDFWLLKVGIEIRESAKAETEHKQWRVRKSQRK
ncbi:phage tail assembly chaperone [Buttiauxella noackiae]|uniref:phage tail assembly chaperone n=1 Tax=Buttiauxella noackiae TaxID=82992 RepID=UPI0005512D64|nr:hypothetical protein [Buttiauxella noackiae]